MLDLFGHLKTILYRLQNLLLQQPILTPLDRPPAHQIDLAPQQRAQLPLHLHVIEQAPACTVRKGNEQVETAVGVKVVAQGGAEEGQLADALALAEVGHQFGAGNVV